jgi:hypothetical protein
MLIWQAWSLHRHVQTAVQCHQQLPAGEPTRGSMKGETSADHSKNLYTPVQSAFQTQGSELPAPAVSFSYARWQPRQHR